MIRKLLVNMLSNVFARVWGAGLQFVFIPIYLHLLGAESYGLLGFFSTLLLSMAFLDLCVSPVIAREFGRLLGRAESFQRMRDLLRSMEIISVGMALTVFIVIYFLAPWLAINWVHADTLSTNQITDSIRLMGLVIACQWPNNLYGGGFIGMHRQDLATKLRVFVTTFQWVGGAAILWLIAPRIELLFIWQAVTFVLLGYLLGRTLWSIMPAGQALPKFDGKVIRKVWRFAIGSLIIGITSALLTQADKWVVVKYVTLEEFAAYALVFTLVSPITMLVAMPIGSTVLPHFSKLYLNHDEFRLSQEYHRWTQVVSAITFPMVGVLLFFGEPLSRIWLGVNQPLVDDLIIVLPWVVLGTLFNTLMMVPYFLQMASGWVRLSIYKNILILMFFIPALIWGVPKYGPVVGGWCWFAINLTYYLIEIPIMHRRLLKKEMWTWWIKDTFLPGGGAASIFFLAIYLIPKDASNYVLLCGAMITAMIACITLFLVLPYPRTIMFEIFNRFLVKKPSLEINRG